MIYRIVLTGGPCAGKSTCVKEISQRLKNDGYRVITVPETAEEVIGHFAMPNDESYDYTMMFQSNIFKYQAVKEDIADTFAKNSPEENIIILYDRSLLDGAAYLPTIKDFYDILRKNGQEYFSLLQKYDLVIALQSLAASRENGYVNSDIRQENPDLAAQRDRKTLNAYLGARNLRIVLPTQTMEEKFDIVKGHIDDFLQNKAVSYEQVQKPITFDIRDDRLMDVGDEAYVSKYYIIKKVLRANDCIYTLTQKLQTGSKGVVYGLEIYDEKTGQFQSTLLSEVEYNNYLKTSFQNVKPCWSRILRYIEDNELYQVEVHDNGLIDHQKQVNVREKPLGLVK